MFSIPVRGSDFFGRFFSGDEIICVTGPRKQDAAAMIEKLRRSAGANDLSFTYAVGVWHTDESIEGVAMKLANQVMLSKSNARRERGMR
jgi:hypothetical protein